jgi:hypothetical protein
MGTNFYFADKPSDADNMDRDYHIGKRSAAGLYCWDCGVTLCQGGISGVHTGRSRWDDKCPNCGQEKKNESLTQSSAGRELGFNKSKPQAKKGVRSCSSFTWAMDPLALFEADRRGGVVDEYGRHYTRRGFLNLLKECPIRFYDSIGQEFS